MSNPRQPLLLPYDGTKFCKDCEHHRGSFRFGRDSNLCTAPHNVVGKNAIDGGLILAYPECAEQRAWPEEVNNDEILRPVCTIAGLFWVARVTTSTPSIRPLKASPTVDDI